MRGSFVYPSHGEPKYPSMSVTKRNTETVGRLWWRSVKSAKVAEAGMSKACAIGKCQLQWGNIPDKSPYPTILSPVIPPGIYVLPPALPLVCPMRVSEIGKLRRFRSSCQRTSMGLTVVLVLGVVLWLCCCWLTGDDLVRSCCCCWEEELCRKTGGEALNHKHSHFLSASPSLPSFRYRTHSYKHHSNHFRVPACKSRGCGGTNPWTSALLAVRSLSLTLWGMMLVGRRSECCMSVGKWLSDLSGGSRVRVADQLGSCCENLSPAGGRRMARVFGSCLAVVVYACWWT